MSKYKLNEGFDLEDERDVLLKAADYKCRLRRSDIEEALEPADLIEDMEYIYNKLCGKYDDVNIKYWRFTTDGIMVRKSDGQVVRIEDDEFDKFYSKGITESWKKGDRVVLSTGETGTVYKDFDWQNEDQVAVQIDGMNKIKYPLSDTLTALRESNELEKRAKHHRKHQDGMSPFCSLGESNYGYKSGDRYYGGLPAEPVYNDVRDAKYWKELVQYFIDTVPNYSGYRIAGRSRVVVILDTPNGREKFDLREFDHLDSAEEAVKVLDDMFKSMVNTNSNDIDESLEVYNGTNIADFDYSNIDLDNSREIGLHCGTEQACKDKGYKCINKLNISNENILALDTDMVGYWSDPAILKHLNNVFSDSEIGALRKKMRAFSGEETGTKYKNYSKIIRDALLDKGYNVISYPNSVEDVGSTSYIILDSSIISKPIVEAKCLKEAPDIFGIETDAEIEAEMRKRREAAWAKRREIIDGDMLGYVSNYEMLDKMATKKTLKDKKDFIVNYIMRDLPEVRKGPDSRGKQSFIYNSKYKDKPVDRAMAEKCADFILDKYKNEDGVRFYKDPNGIVRDANGINVNKTRYNNNDIKLKYREEIMRKKFPNIKYFHKLSKEQQEAVDMEAKELWLADDTYVEIVPLSEAKKKKKPYSSINKNAGNVEYNNAMFNHMNNAAESPSTNPTGPMGESIDDIDDSFDWSIYDYGDSDDYMDDYEYSNTYGGDLTYCPVCNRKLSYDEDGDTYCDNCGESTWSLVQKRRELDRSNMDEDIDGNSDFNAYAPQFGSTASKFIDGVNTVKNLGKTQIQ